jgi:nitrogen fixation/metabolism regulation signal transduction histidine kinase
MYQVDINDVVRAYDFGDENGFLFCLSEAVSNALYCCVNNQSIKIAVQFKREHRANELIKDDENAVTAVSVTDNGTGFANDNFAKFAKTIYKTNHESGKGLGRVAFLKVFRDVYIESCFEENGVYYSRNFKFGGMVLRIQRKNPPIRTNRRRQ